MTKRVLVLGAGLVAKPLLDELQAEPDVTVTVAALNIDRARELTAGRPRAEAVELDAMDDAQLGPAVAEAALVVSLLPAPCHPRVAQHCLRHGAHLVTTSYVSDEMRALDGEAREKGLLLLNETGLDPGIDHMLAARVIRRVRRAGGEILSFRSFCGGLPAPEANDNPWGYKFSWSPRGVLVAARSRVRFQEGGRVIEQPTPFEGDPGDSLEVPGVGTLEVYPTRDSLKYVDAYNLHEVETLFRGTLRYPGWHETWQAIHRLGLLDLEPEPCAGRSWGDWLAQRLGGDEPRSAAAQRLGLAEDHPVLERFAWLGMFSERPLGGAGQETATPLDLLAALLAERLVYAEGERDMVVQEHHFVARDADGGRRRIVARMLVFGTAGDESAMARTVSHPAGIACRRILAGQVDLTGVRIPIDEQLVEPILAGLVERGFEIEEQEEALE